MRAAGKTIKHSLGAPQQLGDYLFLVIDRDGQRNSRVLLVHTRSPRAQRTSRCALIAPFAATRAVGNKHADRRLFTAETPIPRPQIGCIVTSFHARLFRIKSESPPPNRLRFAGVIRTRQLSARRFPSRRGSPSFAA